MPGVGLGAQLVDQIALAERCEQQRHHQDGFSGLRIGALVVLAQGIQHGRALVRRAAPQKITQPSRTQRQIRQRQQHSLEAFDRGHRRDLCKDAADFRVCHGSERSLR